MAPELKAVDISSSDEEQENTSSNEGDDANLMDEAFVLEGDGETRYGGGNDVGNGWDFNTALRKIREEDPVRVGKGALLDSHIAAKRSELLAKKKKKCRVKELDKDGVNSSSVTDPSDEPGYAPIGLDDVKDLKLRDYKARKAQNGSIAAGVSLSDGAMIASNEEADGVATEMANFFSDEVSSGSLRQTTFQGLNLSRPFLRACDKLGYVTPTAVQADCIPHGLAGKDICASATTGSGKTAAFLLPALERLLFRPRRISATRVVVVTPTRELAVQIHSMCTCLTQFTDIQSCLILGGSKNIKAQEAELRSQPDVVVCTPGRMVDHIKNSSGVHCDNVEILILDEADKLLELGFEDEVRFLIDSCPRGRQTMLFSATMNTDVETLATVSFSSRPIKIEATAPNTVADRLIQEFVRVRTSREGNREAMLLSLLSRTFKTRVIVFFDTKVLAHRMMIILGLAGISASELHGNLTVFQRLEALDRFKEGKVAVLAATDVAARGLDISVGRTARAGCGGRAVTLVGEARRIVLKGILRKHEDNNGAHRMCGSGNMEDTSSLSSIQSRSISQSVIDNFKKKVLEMEPEQQQAVVEVIRRSVSYIDVNEILEQEKIDRELLKADMEAARLENIMSHQDEIHTRPAREWIVSNKRKDEVKEQMRKDSSTTEVSGCTEGGKIGDESSQGKKKDKMDQIGKEEKKKEQHHRMTRKKRRRLEAAEAAALQSEKEAEVAAGAGASTNALASGDRKIRKELSERAFVKKAKKDAIIARHVKGNAPIGKRSGIRRKLEIESAFDVERGTEKLNRRNSIPQPMSSFKEFDPTKFLRKGGKLGSKKFKSRNKHKRR